MFQAVKNPEKCSNFKGFRHGELYATVDIGLDRLAETQIVTTHAENPIWDQSFRIYTAHTTDFIIVSVEDQLTFSTNGIIGRAKIPVTEQFQSGEPIQGWFELLDHEEKRVCNAGIRIHLQFTDAKLDRHWSQGIKEPQFSGVPQTFFPLRTNCQVTLYQHSHLSDEYRPPIYICGKHRLEPARCWEDLYRAIDQAQYFIYIAGWSINVSIKLVRDPSRPVPGSEGVTLGELLRRKADEGLTVLVMVWQDPSSLPVVGNGGLMKTHGTETYEYFKDTNVKCFLCARDANPSVSTAEQMQIRTEFTHHQKTVALDAEGHDSGRKVISFVGGIDLCDGRYDDEQHDLFQKLKTAYSNDFQQNNIKDADLKHGGPREPWHDVHSRIEGAAAWDVLTNFEQRWRKQCPPEFLDSLLEIGNFPATFPPPESYRSGDDSQPPWSVQVFRSIDDASVIGFQVHAKAAFALGLHKRKDITADRSIHAGYVEAIRRAKRFIYIENQYFSGSCFAWSEDRDCGCSNLVPIEIALKIASKIRSGERFCAYVVTPMWPEGKPDSDSVQAILHWNRKTMEMMYRIIGSAIDEVGMKGKASVCDYLNFYCLGNREVKRADEYRPLESPEVGCDYWRAQMNRRAPIYVHSKLMIVDDEYIIIGSANLNQRSLDGGRDTEIAHGSFQPAHINGPKGPARGHIYGYRMSLWYELFAEQHMEKLEVFNRPESLDCVRMVNEIAHRLWELYSGDEVVELPGYLLPFPVRVLEDGTLADLTESGMFPDTSASIKGKRSHLPHTLTT
ncbi:unnamed protein product [Victoria cruziana]